MTGSFDFHTNSSVHVKVWIRREKCAIFMLSSLQLTGKPLKKEFHVFVSRWPEGSSQRGEDGVGGDVHRLFEGPVVGGEGPRQRDLAQGRDEVGAPEEEEHVVELEEDEVLVVEGLPAVEGKLALGVRTLSWRVGGVEGLEEVEEEEGDWSSYLRQAGFKLAAQRGEVPTLGSQVSSACSHSDLLNTLYTCSLDVDKKLSETTGQGGNVHTGDTRKKYSTSAETSISSTSEEKFKIIFGLWMLSWEAFKVALQFKDLWLVL